MTARLLVLFLCCLVLHCVAGVPTKKKKEKKTEPKHVTLVEFDPSWPSPGIRPGFGEIGGLSFDPLGNAFVFHRADRSWDPDDFNEKFSYVRAKYGAIEANPIVALDRESNVLFSFGRGRFYLPHGITVDNHGNVWVTDVALHQVLKFPPGKTSPSMSLGESLIPGSDDKHFCQPTSVAVASNGDFFVADGYCNSRILKFNSNGTLLKKWGRKRKDKEPLSADHLSIPHGITLVESRDLVCVADREHSRVQCYTAGLKDPKAAGRFQFNVTSDEMGRPYGVQYNAHYDVLLVLASNDVASRGYVFCLKKRRVINYFDNPAYRGFGDGHALASSPDGRSLTVGSLTPQCPDVTHPQCRFQDSPLNQNLWRFFLFGAEDQPKIDFSEEELKEAEKRANEVKAAEEEARLENEERERERAMAEQWLEEWQERQRP